MASPARSKMPSTKVRRGYNHPDNLLRASIVDPPEFARKNTGDNTRP